MTGLTLGALTDRVPASRRPMMVLGVTVRVAGVAMLAYAVPLMVNRLPHPGWFLALVGVVGLQGVAVAVWWLRRGEIVHATVFSDLPLGAAALFLGPLLASHAAQPGWTMLAIPYTVFVSFSCGLICRTLPGSVGVGAAWAGAAIVGAVVFGSLTAGTSVLLVAAYVVIPGIGWTSARLMRRAAQALERAQSDAVREAAELAVARERVRHGTALHDRVLQTLEVLGRGAVISSAELRERVQAQATWLRYYVESGQPDEDLTARIAAAVREALPGVAVEINDATLVARGLIPSIGPGRRATLVAAVRQAAQAFGAAITGIVVRAAAAPGGLIVSLVAEGASGPAVVDLGDAGPPFHASGGVLTVEPASCVELWMPSDTAAVRDLPERRGNTPPRARDSRPPAADDGAGRK